MKKKTKRKKKTKVMMRVLYLHGCCQTAEMMQQLMKKYERIGRQYNVQFFFLDGQYQHPERGRCWTPHLLWPKDVGTVMLDEDHARECVQTIHTEVLDKEIDALLGFSQGAAMVDVYLSLVPDTPVQRAVLMAPFRCLEPTEAADTRSRDTRTLLLSSKEDKVAPVQRFPIEDFSQVECILH